MSVSLIMMDYLKQVRLKIVDWIALRYAVNIVTSYNRNQLSLMARFVDSRPLSIRDIYIYPIMFNALPIFWLRFKLKHRSVDSRLANNIEDVSWSFVC